MALLLYRLGKFSYRRRWLVISLWLAALVAVGGSAAAFHGTLSNNFQIPGTETQRIADKLKEELPSASGGTATIVFEAPEGGFTEESRTAVTDALKKLETLPDVRGTVDPFATQAQVDQAAQAITDGGQQLAAGEAQLAASRTELEAGRSRAAAHCGRRPCCTHRGTVGAAKSRAGGRPGKARRRRPGTGGQQSQA
jgi:putative drug exporter of the RND superfamily